MQFESLKHLQGGTLREVFELDDRTVSEAPESFKDKLGKKVVKLSNFKFLSIIWPIATIFLILKLNVYAVNFIAYRLANDDQELLLDPYKIASDR